MADEARVVGAYKIKPWEYNPSRWWQRVLVAVLASVGVLMATALGLYQWRLVGGVWDPVFGEQSEQVLDSYISQWMHHWFRIPDAIWGSLAYLVDVVIAVAGCSMRWKYRPWMVFLFGVVVIAVGFGHGVLIIIQGFVLSTWCLLCLISAGVSAALILLAYNEVWASMLFVYRVRKQGGWRAAAETFWGRPSPLAEALSKTITTAEATPASPGV